MHKSFLKRTHLPIGGSVLKTLPKRTLPELVAILIEFVVAQGGFIYDLHEDDAIWLKTVGVDFEAKETKLASAAAEPSEKRRPRCQKLSQ